MTRPTCDRKQGLDAGLEFGLPAALTVEMCSPPESGLRSMRRPGEKSLALPELFLQGLAEPGPRVLSVPVGHGPGEPQQFASLLSFYLKRRKICPDSLDVFIRDLAAADRKVAQARQGHDRFQSGGRQRYSVEE
jgi:hypothetical protein